MSNLVLNVLTTGLGGTDIAWLILRVLCGSFFLISGYHKLFNERRHAALVSTLQSCGVPFIWFNQWWVPSCEFVCGMFVAIGCFTVPAAMILVVICLIAVATDGTKRIRGYAPIDMADCIDDILYLPEALYILVLAMFITAGGGPLSIDRIVL